MSGHTPGPWVFRLDIEGLGFVQGPTHAEGHYFNPADARLIAKAPEMYDCLRASVWDHDPVECGPIEDWRDGASPLCWPHRILAEIDQ